MLVSDIVKLNAPIESRNSNTTTPDRKRLWAKFLEELSTEEASAFYFALRQTQVEADTAILRQGERNDRLYLAETGQLKVTHRNHNREQLIRTLSSGDVFGQETFFSINVCTVTVTALSAVQLSYFERGQLERLKTAFPFMEAVLKKSGQKGPSIADLVQQKGIERRTRNRVPLQLKMTFQVVAPDSQKALQRPVGAELGDISRGGLSFHFRSRDPESVQRLVGRTLGVQFSIPLGGHSKKVSLTGVVHGVQNHPMNDYSVHLRFNRELSSEALQVVVGSAGAHALPPDVR